MHAATARQSFFRPGGDHLMLLAVYNDVSLIKDITVHNFLTLFLSGCLRIIQLSGALIISSSTGSDTLLLSPHLLVNVFLQVTEASQGYTRSIRRFTAQGGSRACEQRRFHRHQESHNSWLLLSRGTAL